MGDVLIVIGTNIECRRKFYRIIRHSQQLIHSCRQMLMNGLKVGYRASFYRSVRSSDDQLRERELKIDKNTQFTVYAPLLF